MEDNLRYVRVLADYQFGKNAGIALFKNNCKFIISPKTGKIRQIVEDGLRIATIKADTGLLTISIEGAKRLKEAFEYPSLRVVVLKSVADVIARGKNVFAKHVVDVDEGIRANDEVIVVDEEDNLLATGKAILSAYEMLEFERGVAVKVRRGVRK